MRWRWIAFGAVVGLGCGRSSFPGGELPPIGASDSGSDTAPESEPNPEPEPRPDPDAEPPAPVEPEDDCGDGIITPGELCFDPQVTFASRIDPCSIDIGDLDDDGHLDVAVPNSDFDHAESPDNVASVLYGDGTGRLSAPLSTLAGGDIPVGLAITDVDLDGVDDLVVANSDSGQLNTIMGVGSRVFAPPSTMVIGGETLVAAAADLDGDDFAEVGVTVSTLAAVAVAPNAGGVLATPILVPVQGSPWGLAFGDVDGNGTVDLLATDANSALLSVRYGQGDGTFADSDAGLTVGYGATDVVVVDLDGNGALDVVTANHGEDTVSVVRGQGGGVFAADPVLYTDYGPRAVAVADFDVDGTLDLAVVHDGAQVLTFFRGVSGGPFEPTDLVISVGTLPSGLRAGDFNEDGIDDLAVSNQLDNEVALILSNP